MFINLFGKERMLGYGLTHYFLQVYKLQRLKGHEDLNKLHDDFETIMSVKSNIL